MSNSNNKLQPKFRDEINKTIKDSLSLASSKIVIGFWNMGFLFSLGYVGIGPNFSNFTFWEKIFNLLISYFLWPLILGDKLSK